MKRQERFTDILEIGNLFLPVINPKSFTQDIGNIDKGRNAEIQVPLLPEVIGVFVRDNFQNFSNVSVNQGHFDRLKIADGLFSFIKRLFF